MYEFARNIYYKQCSKHYMNGAGLSGFCHRQNRLEDFVGEIADFHDETAGPRLDFCQA